jgi:hypothetical protein
MKSMRAHFAAGAILVVVGALTSAAETKDSNAVASLKSGAHVLLQGKAASELIEYCGSLDGLRPSNAEPSAKDIDRLEALLAPLLADDLLSEGSRYRPNEYYRQYAAANWKEHALIYVLGFHQNHLATVELSGHDSSYWKSKPVRVSDGGSAYWCAIYLQESGSFVRMKQESRPLRTVRFNGYG